MQTLSQYKTADGTLPFNLATVLYIFANPSLEPFSSRPIIHHG